MLLDYGSDVLQPGNRETFARFYAAIAQALVKWEPGEQYIRYFGGVAQPPDLTW